MKKLRSDSKWHGITPQAREQVVHWLFEKGMSYKAVLERTEKEFGVKISMTSLARFYRHVADERQLAGLNLPPASVEELRAASLKLLHLATYNAALDDHRPEAAKRFVSLTKLLLQENERELKAKWLELESQRLGLAVKPDPKP